MLIRRIVNDILEEILKKGVVSFLTVHFFRGTSVGLMEPWDNFQIGGRKGAATIING